VFFDKLPFGNKRQFCLFYDEFTNESKMNLLRRDLFVSRAFFTIGITFALTLLSMENAFAQDKNQMVRMAKLVIDPSQLENYRAFLKEEIQTSLRVEPGVLTLYAVSEKDNSNHITIFEIYASAAAYKSHVQTPHFLKYKAATKDMVKSLELIDVDPLLPGTKIN